MGDDASGFVECLAANKITSPTILILHLRYILLILTDFRGFQKMLEEETFHYLHPRVSLIRAQNVRVERDESVVPLIPASWNDLRRVSLVHFDSAMTYQT